MALNDPREIGHRVCDQVYSAVDDKRMVPKINWFIWPRGQWRLKSANICSTSDEATLLPSINTDVQLGQQQSRGVPRLWIRQCPQWLLRVISYLYIIFWEENYGVPPTYTYSGTKINFKLYCRIVKPDTTPYPHVYKSGKYSYLPMFFPRY